MRKIYLVDDQPISNFITKKLIELEGFDGNVEDYTDPTMAFESVVKDENALIFLDLNMPVMNGWDFLEAMKNKNVRHRIIILTSSTSKIDKEKAKEYPCVIKYMVKPMNKKKFSELSDYLKAS
ncbi:response regulator [Christiangramia forsetii]|uniref:Protein containing response regulator receiver domain n=2 Tax=Christiangramia forsetii TaxID=411153 RepID=A0M3I6_CHRFK|nr:response regulator [Christiangramia forsetii]GGG25774.1 response regulator [Christiangramia forsetii]CAL67181.1 protein containing response regulator receiver domain [Christiangramia forsetii KT0803]